MTGLFTGWMAGGAAAGAGRLVSTCTCRRTCTCAPGGPCRCARTCGCRRDVDVAPAAPAWGRPDLWAESGESELGRRGRPAVGPAPRRALPAVALRRLWLLRRQHRRRALNDDFARRFGWGPHAGRIGAAIGCGGCPPGSDAFAAALARWQRGQGLWPSGVLTPATWWRLRPVVLGDPWTGGSSADPSRVEGDPPPDTAGPGDADAGPSAGGDEEGA